jgi:hypothetical protein
MTPQGMTAYANSEFQESGVCNNVGFARRRPPTARDGGSTIAFNGAAAVRGRIAVPPAPAMVAPPTAAWFAGLFDPAPPPGRLVLGGGGNRLGRRKPTSPRRLRRKPPQDKRPSACRRRMPQTRSRSSGAPGAPGAPALRTADKSAPWEIWIARNTCIQPSGRSFLEDRGTPRRRLFSSLGQADFTSFLQARASAESPAPCPILRSGPATRLPQNPSP